MNRIVLALLLLVCGGAMAADDVSTVEAKLKAAMESDIRTEKEVERDRNRKPVETLEFFGLRDDMKIIELLPGCTWHLEPAGYKKGC
jgi:predicted methyltransferase